MKRPCAYLKDVPARLPTLPIAASGSCCHITGYWLTSLGRQGSAAGAYDSLVSLFLLFPLIVMPLNGEEHAGA